MKTVNKKLLVLSGLLVIICAGFVGYSLYTKDTTDISQAPIEKVTNKEFNVSFSYPSGPEGFALIEPPAANKGVLKSYLMILSKEYEEFKTAKEGKNTPATMSVFVFAFEDETASSTQEMGTTTERESRITRLQNWAIDNEVITSFSKAENTPDIVEIDGLKALHYKAAGVFKQDIYLVSYKNRVYMLVGQYKKESDPTYVAFQEIIKTVSF